MKKFEFDFLSFQEKQVKTIEGYINSEYHKKLREESTAYKKYKESNPDCDESFEEMFCDFIFANKKILESYEKEFCNTIFEKIDMVTTQNEDGHAQFLKQLRRDYQKRDEGVCFLKWLIQDLCNDIDIASFMFMGYYDAEKCNKPDTMKELIDSLETMESDKRKEYENIKDNFPFAINGEESIENWCYDYKKELFRWDNISIFDLMKEIKPGHDLARYRFSKTKRIYDKLFSDKIENIFMLENSLGVSLTNTIYSYCGYMNGMNSYNKIKNIIKKITGIYGIYSRNGFVNFIFDYLSNECFADAAISEVERMIDLFIPFINESFVDLLQVSWWWKINEENMADNVKRKKYIEKKRRELYKLWDSFYDDRVPYKDLLESLGLCYFEEMDGTSENTLKNLEILFNQNEKLIANYRNKTGQNETKEKNDNAQSGTKNTSLSDYIKEVNRDNYCQAIESNDKVQMKLTTKKLDRNMLYAVIHCDVVRSGLQFFNEKIYKKIKRPSAQQNIIKH